MICVLFLLTLSVVASDKVHVNGIGGTFPWPIMSDWIYAYTLTHPNIYLNYTIVSTAQTNKDLTSDKPSADFYSTVGFLTRNDTELAGKQEYIQFIPFTISSIVPTYNIPSLAYADGTPGTPQLILSTDTLADIFRCYITNWNDTRITKDNPNVILPDAPITTVLRRDNTGFTYTFMAAFSKFVSDWEYPPANLWPQEIIDLPYTHMAVDNFGMISDVKSIENSIGYMALPQLVTQHIDLASSHALMINENGEVVGPTEEYILMAQENKTFDQYLFANFLNSKHGWPIIMTSFIAIRADTDQDCAAMRELFNFIFWTKTSPEGLSHNVQSGYSRWAEPLNDQILEFLLTATCDGERILRTEYAEQHHGKSFPAFLGLSLILLAISVVLGGIWHYLNQSRCSKVVVLYQSILLLGVALTYLSVIFWYMVPSSGLVCQLRVWLTTLGYCFILTAMFERTWQIRRVYGKVVKNNQLKATVSGFVEVGGGIGIVIILQVVILAIWTAVDPFTSVDVLGHTPFDATYECASKNPNIWLSLETVYFGILLIWCVFVMYSTWSIRTFIVESRWILIAMYNVVLFLALLATLFATLELTDDLLYNLIVPFILLSTTSVVIAVYLPSILKELNLIVSTDSNGSHSQNTKTSKSYQTGEESGNTYLKKGNSGEKGDTAEENGIELN